MLFLIDKKIINMEILLSFYLKKYAFARLIIMWFCLYVWIKMLVNFQCHVTKYWIIEELRLLNTYDKKIAHMTIQRICEL